MPMLASNYAWVVINVLQVLATAPALSDCSAAMVMYLGVEKYTCSAEFNFMFLYLNFTTICWALNVVVIALLPAFSTISAKANAIALGAVSVFNLAVLGVLVYTFMNMGMVVDGKPHSPPIEGLAPNIVCVVAGAAIYFYDLTKGNFKDKDSGYSAPMLS